MALWFLAARSSVLLIRDLVLPEGEGSLRGKQMDLTMLIMTGGQERSEEEWRSLLGASGFALANVRRLPGSTDLIEAKPVR